MGKTILLPMVAGAFVVGALAWFLFQAKPLEKSMEFSSPPQHAADSAAELPKAEQEANENNPAISKDTSSSDDQYSRQRENMVKRQLEMRGINEPRVLEAMNRVPRHRFVPDKLQDAAYNDSPLPIGHGQTISQPYIVALMTESVEPKSDSKALDIGTGSGYQAAILAELVDQVYSIEIVEPLADEASQRLEALGYKNIEVRSGDGYRGWPEHAPFDVIIVAAAPDHIPEPLVEQLAVGGKMVIPVGDDEQNLLLIEKKADGTVEKRNVTPVRFVPMTGEAVRQK